MALLAQAHHLTPVVLEYLDALLKNIARTLYDGIRELPYDAIDLLGTLNINTEYFWDLVNARDDRVLEKLRVCLERLVSSSPDPEEEPEPKRQRRPSSPLVTLAVAMGDEPQVPRVPSTSYSSTRDATIVKLRKEIRDKANDRERKLREAYELNDFDPTAMDTVDG